jgi:CBS domain-containing protein
MKVKEIMTTGAGYCSPDNRVTDAAVIMWQKDCGVVPVVGSDNKVIGVVTDRDICIALASRNQTAADIRLGDLIGKQVVTVSQHDEIKTAAKLMGKKQIHRLPVVDDSGNLVGMLSIADLIKAAGGKTKDKTLSSKKIFKLIAAINRKPPIVLMAADNQGADEETPDDSPHETSSVQDVSETN